MKTHKKGVGWPCGRGPFLGVARCELYFMPAAITIE